MNTTPKMTDESTHSPSKAVTPTARVNVNEWLIELLEKFEPSGCAARAVMRLGPNRFCRSRTSSADRPADEFTRRKCTTCSADN